MHRALVVGLLTAVSAVTYRLAEPIHGTWSAVTFGFAMLVGAAAAFWQLFKKLFCTRGYQGPKGFCCPAPLSASSRP